MRTSLRRSKAKGGLSQFFFGVCLSFMGSTVLLGFRRAALCHREEVVNNTLLFFAGMVAMVGYLKNRKVDVLGFSFGVMVNLKNDPIV